jgi:hypothetical protein
MSDDNRCGNHEELAKTAGFRISRCACGTVHLHVVKSGVTLQLSATSLAELVNAATVAHRKTEAAELDPARHPASSPAN